MSGNGAEELKINFFTKYWYKLCQKTDSHFPLEEDKKAESFSEEYFQQLYNHKLSEWLHLQEEISKYQAELGVSKENHLLQGPFDREKASKQFHELFIYRQEKIKEKLPEEILKMIADIRVYVLDKASHEVIKAVTIFCEDNKESVKQTIEDYKIYYNKAIKAFDKKIVENINFHDCIIIDIKQTKQLLSILFDNSGGFTDINEIQFENYKILKQEAPLQNLWWLYDEIYKINNKYELHVLLKNENMDLVDFIVSFDHFVKYR